MEGSMEKGDMIRQEKYHETKKHGLREFPFNIYPCSIPGDFQNVALHWHEEMEIISIKKGQGNVVVDRVVYEVEEGDVMAVFPGQLHAIYGFEDQRMDYENIIFSLSLLMGAEEDLCTERFLFPLAREQVREPLFKRRGVEGYEAFAGCIQALDCVSEERGTGYQLAVKGQLYTFLYLAFQSGLTLWEKRPGRARERIKQVLGYIEEHYGEEFDISQAAGMCFYSQSHFMKYFKQYTGQPFVSYLNDYRLSRAGGFLRTTGDTVTEIAVRCGFDNLSYFNRLFRRKYGMTPKEYRES